MHIFRFFGLIFLGLTFAAAPVAAEEKTSSPKEKPKTETVKAQQLVEEVDFQGNRRLRDEDLLYYVKTRAGDTFSPEQLQRDLRELLALEFFDKTRSRVLTEEGVRGGVKVIFEVSELPVIRDLQFEGLKAIPESDVLKAFREQRVRISKESVYNPVNAQRATRVIREGLASKGYPNATVTPKVEEVSATSIALTFVVDQGNRSRIVEIDFEGNEIFKDGELRGQLKLVKEANLISRIKGQDILDLQKLQYDLQTNVRQYMFSKGYFQARIGEPQVVGLGYQRTGFFIPLPIISSKDDTLRIVVPVTEGKVFRVGDVKVEGNSIFSEQQITAYLGLQKGEVINGDRFIKGLREDLAKVYGSQGFVLFDAEPETEFKDSPSNPKEGIVDITINIDEGKQFRLRRLEFTGNTFTRDRVLRREILVNEGDIYNQIALENSVIRLNQTGYFDPIDKDKDVEIRTDEESGDVDLIVKVAEKGRQQIQFNGGIGGLGGSFFGLEYSTNNLLGRGEVLALNFGFGNRQRSFQLSFTEPYFRDRPITVGFSVFGSSYKFFGEGTFLSQNQDLIEDLIIDPNAQLTADEENLFTQTTYGASVYATAPLSELLFRKRAFSQFSRVGLTYSFSATSIADPPINESDPSRAIPIIFEQSGIITSRVTGSFVYDRRPRNNGIDTIQGRQLALSLAVAGLGGDVRTYQPSLSYSEYIPVRRKRSANPEVFAFRILAGTLGSFSTRDKIANSNSLSFINGVPYYERYFLGSENDIRGYTSRSIGPIAPIDSFLTTRNVVVATNATGAPTLATGLTDAQRNLLSSLGTFTGATGANNGFVGRSYRIIGGDTQILGNFEYRVPIFGPATLAAFADIGTVFNLRKGAAQTINSNFLPDQPFLGGNSIGGVLFFRENNPYQQTLAGSFLIKQNGDPITKTEYIATYCTPAVPPATTPTCTTPPTGTFREVFLRGEAQTNTVVRVDEAAFSGIGDFRSSVGLELRVQVPIVNVPFRLIYYFNPNAKLGVTEELPGLFLPGKRSGFRFTVGRTF